MSYRQKIWFWSSVVLVCGLILPLAVQAQGYGRGRGGGPGMGRGRGAGPGMGGGRGGVPPRYWLDTLNLTQKQRTKIDSIRAKEDKNLQAQRQTVWQEREKMQTMMRGDASQSDLRKQNKKLQAAKMKYSDLRFESVLAIREVLTPEQRKNFGMRQGRGWGGPGRRRGRGGRGNFGPSPGYGPPATPGQPMQRQPMQGQQPGMVPPPPQQAQPSPPPEEDL